MLGVLCTRPKPWILSALSINVTQHHHYQRCCGGSGSVLSFAEDYNRRRRHHSSACRSIVSGGAASIWHAILPSSRNCRNNNNLKLSFHHHHEQKGEGSWNVAWDARPARWLHGSDSAWLLFGVCACACVAPFDCCSGNPETTALVTSAAAAAAVDDDVVALVGKDELETDDERSKLGYRVIGVPADGRCLFRAISHGACLRNGEEAPDSDRQRELADDLRVQIVDELLKRRKETEWFIEGDFDAYVKSIQEPSTWAGEPELLMSSHVLRTPISVFMIDKSSGKLSNVANYGQEYANDKKSPIKVVFHGYGHYDVLETFGS